MPFVHRKPPTTVAELMQAIESLDGMVAETEAWAEQPVPEIRDSFDWDYKHHLIMNAELMIDENFMDENLDGVGDVSFMEKGGFVPPFSVAVAHHNSAKGKERCA
ncbi:hypothetical protein FRC03_006834 [Tulasnella sp. 419]|nr:hypothetical protein FRC03_006834 [Tulasnella sp. 419]